MKESLEILENPEDKKGKVLEQIKFIRQKVAIMGFNDSEIPELNELLEKVEGGEVDPQKALERAHEIINSKQDYH